MTVNPMFYYKFARGHVTFSQDEPPASVADRGAYMKGRIIGVTDDGKTRDYGDPFVFPERKLHLAAAMIRGDLESPLCGIRAAAEHTRLINRIGENFPISDVSPARICERGELLYVDGLADELISEYNAP